MSTRSSKPSPEIEARAIVADLARELRWGVNLSRAVAKAPTATREALREIIKTAQVTRERMTREVGE